MDLATAQRHEKDWKGPLRRRPEEWARLVRQIRGGAAIRNQTACIIWYDFFGDRPAHRPWPHLDGYMRAWRVSDNVQPRLLEDALLAVGYPAIKAHERSRRMAICAEQARRAAEWRNRMTSAEEQE